MNSDLGGAARNDFLVVANCGTEVTSESCSIDDPTRAIPINLRITEKDLSGRPSGESGPIIL